MDSLRFPRLAAMALMLAAITPAFPAQAGLNSGATATLTWSDTSTVSDLTPSGGTRRLYLRLSGIQSLKAVDAEVVWTPTGVADPAYEVTSWDVPTGATCKWLMRGTVVPIAGVTDSTFRIGAVASELNESCTAGNVLKLSFANGVNDEVKPDQDDEVKVDHPRSGGALFAGSTPSFPVTPPRRAAAHWPPPSGARAGGSCCP
jgi:hypothetical protein